jgi:hypothetical protein
MKLMSWLRAERERAAGFALILAGAVMVIAGYVGVKGTPYVVVELSYIASGGVIGIFCLGLGASLMLSADIHDEWRKLDQVEAALRHLAEIQGPVEAPTVILTSGAQSSAPHAMTAAP